MAHVKLNQLYNQYRLIVQPPPEYSETMAATVLFLCAAQDLVSTIPVPSFDSLQAFSEVPSPIIHFLDKLDCWEPPHGSAITSQSITFYLTHILPEGDKIRRLNLVLDLLGYMAENDLTSTDKRSSGSFYTPPVVSTFIVETLVGYALAKALPHKPSAPFDPISGLWIYLDSLDPAMQHYLSCHVLPHIKILDSSCGAGEFLISAFRVVMRALKALHKKCSAESWTPPDFLLHNLYGADLNPLALHITHLRLLGLALESSISSGGQLPALVFNLRRGNSLVGKTFNCSAFPVFHGRKGLREARHVLDELWTSKEGWSSSVPELEPLHWCEVFPEVEEEGGFDIVVGNPPYVRNRELSTTAKKIYSATYHSASGQYDLYQLFFERNLALTKEGGFVGLITSNKFTVANYGKSLRQFLLTKSSLRLFINVSDLKIFEKASTYPYITILEKKNPNSGKDKPTFQVLELVQATIQDFQEKRFIAKHMFQHAFLQLPNYVLSLELSQPLLDLFKKMRRDTVELGSLCEIREASHTGNVRSKVLLDNPTGSSCYKVVGGRELSRYNVQWSGRWITTDPKHVKREAGDYARLLGDSFFRQEKIMVRDIGTVLHATYDGSGLHCLNTIFCLVLKENIGVELKFILGVLNSSLITLLFTKMYKGSHVRGGYLRFKITYLKQVPIPTGTSSQQKTLVELVNRRLTLAQTAITDKQCQNRSKLMYTSLDREIDDFVSDLYGLTDEERRLVGL